MNKRCLILLLSAMNLLLLGALALSVYTPPSALAQAAGARRGEYLLFGARADVTNDAIYLLDAGNKKLHLFRSAYPREPVTGATAVAYVRLRHRLSGMIGSRALHSTTTNAASSATPMATRLKTAGFVQSLG